MNTIHDGVSANHESESGGDVINNGDICAVKADGISGGEFLVNSCSCIYILLILLHLLNNYFVLLLFEQDLSL